MHKKKMKGSSANKIEQFTNGLHFFKSCLAVTVISKARGAVRRCQTGLHGTASTASLPCLSAASHKGHSFDSPLSPYASASCGTPESQPSAENSAPVDTRRENT